MHLFLPVRYAAQHGQLCFTNAPPKFKCKWMFTLQTLWKYLMYTRFQFLAKEFQILSCLLHSYCRSKYTGAVNRHFVWMK